MKSTTTRVRLLFGCIVFCALILITKLYLLQVVSGEMYSTRADRQYTQSSYNVVNRGTIYFRTKSGTEVTAATQQTGYTLAVNPEVLKDPEAAYKQINSVIPLDKELFITKATKKDDPYEEVLKKIDVSPGDKINSLEIPGVSLYKQKWRTYPGGPTASNVLGIVGYKGDELGGRYGLERQYEEVLQRKDDSLYVNFFAEIFLNIKKTISSTSKSEGDIVTSIEPSVQLYLERELGKINETWKSDYSGGIIIDPKTGEIIAMAQAPTFNPNSFQDVKDPALFSNPLVENVLEMGSIIKPITMASGIDSGAVTAQTTYFDAGFLTLNGKKISNYDGKGRGVVDMQQVLNQSLNTGVSFVAKTMGKEKFSKYMLDFGLGEKTGIDLPNEAAPLVDNLHTGRDVEQATASFGQGIAMTPIATTRALSVLANGGVLMHPHVVSKINYKTGLSTNVTFEPGRQVIKKETATEITRMLVNVVDVALQKGTVKNEHYSVAAKTGTAQISQGGGKGYYENKFLHSFFGYFPAYDAHFLIFLYTYYPKDVQYASETLTKSFIDLTKYLINYYEIPPDR